MTGLSRACTILWLSALSCSPRDDQRRPASVPTADHRHEEPVGPLANVRRAASAHMPSHFADVLEVHSALIRGSLDEARTAARDLLEERPVVMLEEWAPYVFAVDDASRRVVEAGDVGMAATAAAELARSCGSCHLALGVTLPFEPTTAPDTTAVMRRHKWAFDRLWEGLVLPSEAAWSLGTAAFVEFPACAQSPAAQTGRAALLRLEQAAREATSWPERAGVYGQMLPTCSSCHAEPDACEPT